MPLAAPHLDVLAVTNLRAGAEMAGGGEEAGGQGHAFCLVSDGEVVFLQGRNDIVLSRGDALTWDVANQYRFVNRGIAQATLLVGLERQGALPVVIPPASGPRRVPHRELAQSATPGGPLRLVAMRAYRDRHEGGGR
jgi:hypothetical protein